MDINIRRVDSDNYEEVKSLKVGEGQEGFIETNEECLDEAKELDLWRPVGIYDGNELIGFSMYGLFEEQSRVWLDRFMIDRRYQGKGYGKAAIKIMIDRLIDEYNCKEIYLSTYIENVNAINLYESIGFRFNGELDTKGEKVMRLDLK